MMDGELEFKFRVVVVVLLCTVVLGRGGDGRLAGLPNNRSSKNTADVFGADWWRPGARANGWSSSQNDGAFNPYYR